jgi:hypothetical protein
MKWFEQVSHVEQPRYYNKIFCCIWGSHSGDYEEYGILSCNAMQLGQSLKCHRKIPPPSSGSKSKPRKKLVGRFFFLLGLLLDHEDKGNYVPPKCRFFPKYTAVQARRLHSIKMFVQEPNRRRVLRMQIQASLGLYESRCQKDMKSDMWSELATNSPLAGVSCEGNNSLGPIKAPAYFYSSNKILNHWIW